MTNVNKKSFNGLSIISTLWHLVGWGASVHGHFQISPVMLDLSSPHLIRGFVWPVTSFFKHVVVVIFKKFSCKTFIFFRLNMSWVVYALFTPFWPLGCRDRCIWSLPHSVKAQKVRAFIIWPLCHCIIKCWACSLYVGYVYHLLVCSVLFVAA